MTTDQDVDIFLEHFGTAGMKWGVRKSKAARTETQKSHAARNRANKKPLTKKQKAARKERIQTGVVIGGVAAVYMLSLYGKMKADRAFTNSYNEHRSRSGPGPRVSKSVSDVINAQRDVKLKAVRRTFREGHMDKDQLINFTSILNRRYDRRVREATAG